MQNNVNNDIICIICIKIYNINNIIGRKKKKVHEKKHNSRISNRFYGIIALVISFVVVLGFIVPIHAYSNSAYEYAEPIKAKGAKIYTIGLTMLMEDCKFIGWTISDNCSIEDHESLVTDLRLIDSDVTIKAVFTKSETDEPGASVRIGMNISFTEDVNIQSYSFIYK